MIRCVRWLPAALAVVAFVPVAVAAPADPFEACRRQFQAKPQEYESAYCFYTVAQQPGHWADGKRVVEELIGGAPDNLWLKLAYGHVLRDRQPDAAEAQYKRVAEGFKIAGHVEGEFLARSSLRNFLAPKGRIDRSQRADGPYHGTFELHQRSRPEGANVDRAGLAHPGSRGRSRRGVPAPEAGRAWRCFRSVPIASSACA